MKYEPTISVWEDMKEKLCDEHLSPYYLAKYLPQSQCGTFQVEANTMNSHPVLFHVLNALLCNLPRNYLPGK